MGKEKYMSFYEYMTHYPFKEPDRRVLAAEIRRVGKQSKMIRDIDSFVDLMSCTYLLTDLQAIEAITASLWYEYCAFVGRPMDD